VQVASETSKPLKVLHIGKYFPPYTGGMETYLRDLVVAQARLRLAPSALVHQSGISLTSHREIYKTGEQQIPLTRAAVWARLLFTPISPTFPWLMNSIIKQQSPEILHFHMPNVSVFWALFLPAARRLPWVVHWHSDVLASEHSLGLRLFYSLYRPFERAILNRSKRIIATSAAYLDSSAPLRAFRTKCRVVPLGLDPQNLARPDCPTASHENANLRVLAIGRLTYYKGFDLLLRAVASVQGIELHLVGGGELEDSLQQLACDLEATERIKFHGQLADSALAAQYAACDCLCLPSIERTEAFGVVLLEAMSHGKATIVSDVPGSGMSWVVEDGVTGLHTPPKSEAGIASSLRHLRDNRDKLKRFGEQGRRRFHRLFHINESASGVSDIYVEAMNSTPTNRAKQ
jgi:rhamnosyl/mannosyltransferase